MFPMLGFLFAATQAAIPASWDLEETAQHRWILQSDIALPGFMWLYADLNRDVRARALGMQMVLNCSGTPMNANAGHLECIVEDAAFTGTTFPSERGRMLPVLEEMDAKLTGGTVELVMLPRGRVRSVKVVPRQLMKSRNLRTRSMEETLRTLVVRATSAFDLTIPKEGFPEEAWPQFESRLLQLPTLRGTAGAGRLVHRAEPINGTQVAVSTMGKATLVDGATLDARQTRYLDTTVAGFTVFDVQNGRVAEASWETLGEPTASSGLARAVYAARSVVRALEPDETVTLGETREWTPAGARDQWLFNSPKDDGSADAL